MTTIKEIAKACNVSVATVSNVFTGKGRVSEERRQFILQTAKKMNYVPNDLARSLKQRSSRTIGIITEDLTVFNCPNIVDGIHEYLETIDYTYILGNLRLFQKYDNNFYHHEEYATKVAEEFQIMKSKQVSGIIYVGAHNRTIRSIPQDFGLPIVITYGKAANPQMVSVNYDDECGAYDAVSELLKEGHTRIGLVAGEADSMHTIERSHGYRRSLLEHHVPYDESLIYQGAWTRDSGYAAAKVLLSKKVTALFCMNDIMVAGVYDYADKNNIIIGRDLSVIGFDNRDICTILKPELSTIALPLNALGAHSAQILIDMIENQEELLPPRDLKIPCNLIRRASTCLSHSS